LGYQGTGLQKSTGSYVEQNDDSFDLLVQPLVGSKLKIKSGPWALHSKLLAEMIATAKRKNVRRKTNSRPCMKVPFSRQCIEAFSEWAYHGQLTDDVTLLLEFSIVFKVEKLYESILDKMRKTTCPTKALLFLKELKRLDVEPGKEIKNILVGVALDGNRGEIYPLLKELFETSPKKESTALTVAKKRSDNQYIVERKSKNSESVSSKKLELYRPRALPPSRLALPKAKAPKKRKRSHEKEKISRQEIESSSKKNYAESVSTDLTLPNIQIKKKRGRYAIAGQPFVVNGNSGKKQMLCEEHTGERRSIKEENSVELWTPINRRKRKSEEKKSRKAMNVFQSTDLTLHKSDIAPAQVYQQHEEPPETQRWDSPPATQSWDADLEPETTLTSERNKAVIDFTEVVHKPWPKSSPKKLSRPKLQLSSHQSISLPPEEVKSTDDAYTPLTELNRLRETDDELDRLDSKAPDMASVPKKHSTKIGRKKRMVSDPFLPDDESSEEEQSGATSNISNKRNQNLLDSNGRSISKIDRLEEEETLIPHWYEDKYFVKAPHCRRNEKNVENYGFQDIIKICSDHRNKLPSNEVLVNEGLSWVTFLIDNEGGRKLVKKKIKKHFKEVKAQAELERRMLEEEKRKAKLKRKAARKKRRAEEKRAAEQKRKAEEQKRKEEEKKKAAEARRKEEEEKAAEMKKAAEEKERRDKEKAAQEKRRAEEQKAAEEKKKADEKAAKERRKAEEKRRAEEEKAAEEKRKAEEEKAAQENKRIEEEKAAEEKRKAEEQRKAEEKKAAEKRKKAERKKIKAEEKKAEEEKKKAANKKAIAKKSKEEKKKRKRSPSQKRPAKPGPQKKSSRSKKSVRGSDESASPSPPPNFHMNFKNIGSSSSSGDSSSDDPPPRKIRRKIKKPAASLHRLKVSNPIKRI